MGRLNSIDFVKGLAIVWITIYHAYWHIYGNFDVELGGYMGDILPQYVSALRYSIWDGVVKVVCGLGYHGVAIFIVMSGFLQMWSNRKRGVGYRERSFTYFTKRALRIYPLYWIAMLIVILFRISQDQTVAIMGMLEVWPVSLTQFFVDLVGMQAFTPLQMLSLNPSFWFISMIIQFYLIFPAMRGFYMRLGDKRFLLVSLAANLGCLFLSHFIALIHPLFAMGFFGSWLFLFSLGMVLANNYEKITSILRGVKAIIPFLILYVIGVFLCSSLVTWPFGRIIYGSAITLFLLSLYNSIETSRILRIPRRLFEFIGRVSYAMYLTNEPYSQAYFIAVTGVNLFFTDGYGYSVNHMILPTGPFLLVFATYAAILILASYLLTKIDVFIRRKINFFVISLVMLAVWFYLLLFL
jgi:peptidoglycan/LPS O-acetylase OafA/YrhL